MKVVICTIRFFFFWLSLERRWAIRTLSFKQVSYESGTLHNLCSYNFEPNSKDNSEYAVLCSLLRGSTGFFFFWLSMGRSWATRSLNSKEVSYETGNFHNRCSDNLEPNSKDNSEYAVLCSLLRGSPDFFLFWLSMVMRSAITTLKLKEVTPVNGMFPELQTDLSIFQKQVAIAESGSPLTLFQLQDLFSTFAVEQFCPLVVLSQDSERLHFQSVDVLRIRW
jgi:hypothetical protein